MRKYKQEEEQSLQEKELIAKLGRNKTTEKTFNNGIFVDGIELLGFYTYRGEVCILDSIGLDNDFKEYSDENKIIIYNAIMSNKYSI
jgi:hypothetical protein